MKKPTIPEQSWPADSVSRVPTASLIPYARNARTHSDEQVAQIAASIREWGWTIPVLVDEAGTLIAGHGRLLAAQVLGLPEVPVMVARGWSEAKRRAYALADNRLALNAGWDEDMLALEVSALEAEGFDLDLLGFDPEELDRLMDGEPLEQEQDDNYSRKVEAPIYQPSGPKPELRELADESKTKTLRAEIDAAEIPEDIKAFLRLAADRHTVFDFGKIANYYAQSDAAVQDLMERSALVIIDFGKAIEYGFVQLTEEICQQYATDYASADAYDDA